MSLMKIFSLAHTRGCAGLEGVKCREANFYRKKNYKITKLKKEKLFDFIQ